jgi:hypothetical protein
MIYIILGYLFVAISDFFLTRYLNKQNAFIYGHGTYACKLSVALYSALIPVYNVISLGVNLYFLVIISTKNSDTWEKMEEWFQ